MAVLRIALGPITLLHLRPFLRDAIDGIAYDDHFWDPFFPSLPHLLGRRLVRHALGRSRRRGADDDRTVDTCRLHRDVPRRRRQPPDLRDPRAPQPGVPHHPARRRRPRARRSRPVRRRLVAATARAADRRRWRTSGRSGCCAPRSASSTSPRGSASSSTRTGSAGSCCGIASCATRACSNRRRSPIGRSTCSRRGGSTTASHPLAVATELFVGAALWFGRTRLLAIWVAVFFHLMIELSASVEVFSYAAIAALAIWVTPTTGDRIVMIADSSVGRRWSDADQGFDWFGRFRIERGDPSTPFAVDRPRRRVHRRPLQARWRC